MFGTTERAVVHIEFSRRTSLQSRQKRYTLPKETGSEGIELKEEVEELRRSVAVERVWGEPGRGHSGRNQRRALAYKPINRVAARRKSHGRGGS